MSNSISQRARSITLKEKLKEIARQECITTSNTQCTEPQTIQKAVSTRLWRLMQRRLRDPSAGKKLKSIRIANTTLPTPELVEDADILLGFEQEEEGYTYSQPEDFSELDGEEAEEDLLEGEYESEWEDLFTDIEPNDSPADADMLDCLHDGHDQSTAACLEDEVSSIFEDMLEL